jgi:cytidylate kinase
MQKVCQPSLLRFVERETKVNVALEAAAAGYKLDSSGKPKIIIAIGREFGSGGYEIGEKLAQKLGITFYDQQINEMAAEQSGLSMEKVEELEHHMEREIVYDFKNAVYAMSNGVLSPEEQLYVAQSTIIRKIAASDESCVIVGRCADYILYDNPNCFRLFIHSIPEARIDRTMRKYNLSYEQAKLQMENTDAARAQHYKHFTGRIYGKQEYYHLGLDSGMLGTDGSVDVILDMIKKWCQVRGTNPLNILDQE